MLSLHYKLEDVVEIRGKRYPIKMSFDNVLRLIDMLNDDEIEEEYKVILGINMMLGVSFLLPFKECCVIFNDLFQTFIVKKTGQSVETDRQGNPMPPKYNDDIENSYSLKHDADYIFSSFYQAYRLDLIEQQGKLHWDKFNALLSGLPSDTKFKEVLEIRTWEPIKGCSKEEKKRMKDLQRVYALPTKEGDS